ncbi:MAG: DUF418 domain-containing protein, partial [Sphingomonadales bacterium]|nr:DUF418 domain-containing protein [Sphingomonadales bacterium]
AYMSPVVYGDAGSADVGAWLVSYMLVDGKMRGLFSLLFGASMMLVIERAEMKGESAARIHYSRMVWLALFGLFHFFFIWWGDILFLYAAIGSLAFLFRHRTPERLISLALMIYFVGAVLWTALMGSLFFLENAALAPGADAETVRSYEEMMEGFPFSAEKVAEEVAIHRGGYADIVAHKFTNTALQPLTSVLQAGFETLPLMLLGMALLKNGFMLGEWKVAAYLRIAAWLLPIGLAITGAIAWIVIASGFDPLTVMNAAIAWTYPPRLMMTIGYAALLAILIGRFAASPVMARVAATGRAAFTNYLGTSIVMTTIFYGYGLGLYGEVGRIELYLFVLGAWALMLLWSKPWLDRFRFGPLEWLWRSLARMELQPMRKQRACRF